jgi:hypothetical protein
MYRNRFHISKQKKIGGTWLPTDFDHSGLYKPISLYDWRFFLRMNLISSDLMITANVPTISSPEYWINA